MNSPSHPQIQHGGAASRNANMLLAWLLLVFLWWRLIDQMRLEWSSNLQYAYGWAVPFLCAYLVWQLCGTRTPARPAPDELRPPGGGARTLWASLLVALALLYLPIRLLQEASPEWRLVSWGLACIVAGLTLWLLPMGVNGWLSRQQEGRPGVHWREIAFPVLFFLVAVPWPTLVEGPLIAGLTKANTAAAVEIMIFLGVPALQHGNTIEVGTGMVGIDEACSGIRSFQAALMISLFCGELNRLRLRPRLFLVAASFGLSFIFNIIRTSLLTFVAAKRGPAAISDWHDPAGVTILVGCFVAMWAFAAWLGRRKENCATSEIGWDARRLAPSSVAPVIALAAWLGAAEAGVRQWYRWLDQNTDVGVEWTVAWPTTSEGFRELPIDAHTRKVLRFDTGSHVEWRDEEGRRWEAFYFVWNPGRTSGFLAKRHTPEACLTGIGLNLVQASPMEALSIGQVVLPFRYFHFKTPNGVPVDVMHSRWEQGLRPEHLTTESPTAYHLVRGIWAGRGRHGQKVLEIVAWGMPDPSRAETGIRNQLARLVVSPAPPHTAGPEPANTRSASTPNSSP